MLHIVIIMTCMMSVTCTHIYSSSSTLSKVQQNVDFHWVHARMLARTLTIFSGCFCVVSTECAHNTFYQHFLNTLSHNFPSHTNIYINIFKIILTVNVFDRHSSDTKCNTWCEDTLCRFCRFNCCSI